ncbi:MAG TPA: BrnT family toxin [Dehalococcoidia bacterium]|nr:BrnT family toxin [Dehalococcoidia bacterium]
MRFDWDDANRGHVAGHGITPEDVEAVWLDPFRLEGPTYEREGETRQDTIGRQGERLIFVVYTLRGGRIRPVTARVANRPERRDYRSAHT